MRQRHEIVKGIICERCHTITPPKKYFRIIVAQPIISDTQGKVKYIERTNLCENCYNEYISNFNHWKNN